MTGRRTILLYPLSKVYDLVTSARNFLYDASILNSTGFSIPVICVGNLAAGGTGKTPHTEYIAELLMNSHAAAILSRGYRRKTRGFLLADSSSSADEIGDEPKQMHLKLTGVTVAVDSNRVRGIMKILEKKPGTGVIILDDAFQHRRVRPGLSILLTEYNRLFINDDMLPYGNLRENRKNAGRADIIIVTKSPGDLSAGRQEEIAAMIMKDFPRKLFFTSFNYMNPIPLFEKTVNGNGIPSGGDNEGVVLVTGIANPAPLLEYLHEKFSRMIHLPFSDHHRFTPGDMSRILNAWNSLETRRKFIITTEKDAIRLQEFTKISEPARSAFFYIPVGISFLNNARSDFDETITDYVRKNQRDGTVS